MLKSQHTKEEPIPSELGVCRGLALLENLVEKVGSTKSISDK
jgi:hypothetical protein